MLQAKQRALLEGSTLTDLLVQGLKARLEHRQPDCILPISTRHDGLIEGVAWESLRAAGADAENYR